MEPAFQRGDLLVLWNRNLFSETNVGEVVVYNVKGKDIPIVHRIVRKFGTGSVFLPAGNGSDSGPSPARANRFLLPPGRMRSC
jgi:signal peptidase